jgi:hypothetical protein
MSVTNLQIISDSLRALNVINETETPSAEQGSLCLRELNQMLSSWAVTDTVELGYFPQNATSDTCPIPEWAEKGVKYKLALQIAHYFGADPSMSTIAMADEGYTAILRTVLNLALEGADMNHLPRGTGKYGVGFNITTG